jgi:hypothetical protein
MAVGHRPGWPSWASSRDTSPLTLQPPRPFKARDLVLMPGDPRLGIVLSGPQAPWGSPSPRGGHLRHVPPPTTTAPPLTPRDGAALPLPGAASAGQMCRSGRTHEPRRAERRFRAGRRPRQVWSWSGRYGGYQARDQRPPATFRAGGAATYRQVPGPHPRRAFRTRPTGLAGALRWSGERHGDHEIAECAVAVTGDRPRSLALPTTRKG